MKFVIDIEVEALIENDSDVSSLVASSLSNQGGCAGLSNDSFTNSSRVTNPSRLHQIQIQFQLI